MRLKMPLPRGALEDAGFCRFLVWEINRWHICQMIAFKRKHYDDAETEQIAEELGLFKITVWILLLYGTIDIIYAGVRYAWCFRRGMALYNADALYIKLRGDELDSCKAPSKEKQDEILENIKKRLGLTEVCANEKIPNRTICP